MLFDGVIIESSPNEAPTTVVSRARLSSRFDEDELDIEDRVCGVHRSLILGCFSNQAFFICERDE